MDPVAQREIAAAFLLVAIGTVVLIWRRGFSRASVKGFGMEVALAAVDRARIEQTLAHAASAEAHAAAANAAVNNVPAGTPPLTERVAAIEEDARWVRAVLFVLAEHLGVPIPSPGEPP